MNICTIADLQWVPTHLTRFIKLARRAMPESKYHLLLVADEKPKHPTIDMFDKVKRVKTKPQKGYLYYNALRYDLLRRFKLDECLYVDPDVDFYASIEETPRLNPKADLMWVRSPLVPGGFQDMLTLCNLWNDDPVANSGMLYMRRNFLKEYKAAVKEMERVGFQSKPGYECRGNAAFSIMQRRLPKEVQHELPYFFSVIWHDFTTAMIDDAGQPIPAWKMARSLHYCGDAGKAERAKKDGMWIY